MNIPSTLRSRGLSLLTVAAFSILVTAVGQTDSRDHPTRLLTFAAQKLAAVCRHIGHTQVFGLLVPKLIQSASRRPRRDFQISNVEVIV